MEQLAELKNTRGDVVYTLSYVRERNYLYAEWVGYAVRQNILDGGQSQLDWARANAVRLGTTVVVNDNRRMRGGWEPAVEWARQVWAPAMFDAGIRHNAVILSPDLPTQVSTESMVDDLPRGAVAMQVFPSLQDAERWIVANAEIRTE